MAADEVTIDRDAAYDVIEAEFAQLEKGVSCPGTQVARVMLDNSLVEHHGLKPNPEREFTWVWSVMWGSTVTPPLDIAFGNTLREAVGRSLALKQRSLPE